LRLYLRDGLGKKPQGVAKKKRSGRRNKSGRSYSQVGNAWREERTSTQRGPKGGAHKNVSMRRPKRKFGSEESCR